MNIFKGAVVCGILLLNTACSTIPTDSLTNEEAVALEGKALTYSQYDELPDFPAQTALNVQFGLLGVLSAIESGNTILENNQISDPALDIAKDLAKGIEENYDVNIIENDKVISVDAGLSDVVAAYDEYDYVVDVKTTGWGSIYYLEDWDNYKLSYGAHARLIDVKEKEVVVEVQCFTQPAYDDSNEGPSYEQLENGEGLKKEIARAVEICVDYIVEQGQLRQQETNQPVEALADNH
ncbi:hypothetical protein [Enterovibrio nigricans]|uniref:Uncharacterized protein n=1 Tax=Enterovibrio nigricans DSM 22720 TaxID=1121868 RepID=A0A1T4W2C1_9GAMM|nr:hypothetical protein [Enterovibrio nigricans]PKF48994.1 hypothetical protein AT251_22095 [Enterovibrio nigricans]SKA71393.1 hypothetical protein SAMN02745132_04678 [Enterovibrio nigricans DSM 22720]